MNFILHIYKFDKNQFKGRTIYLKNTYCIYIQASEIILLKIVIVKIISLKLYLSSRSIILPVYKMELIPLKKSLLPGKLMNRILPPNSSFKVFF